MNERAEDDNNEPTQYLLTSSLVPAAAETWSNDEANLLGSPPSRPRESVLQSFSLASRNLNSTTVNHNLQLAELLRALFQLRQGLFGEEDSLALANLGSTHIDPFQRRPLPVDAQAFLTLDRAQKTEAEAQLSLAASLILCGQQGLPESALNISYPQTVAARPERIEDCVVSVTGPNVGPLNMPLQLTATQTSWIGDNPSLALPTGGDFQLLPNVPPHLGGSSLAWQTNRPLQQLLTNSHLRMTGNHLAQTSAELSQGSQLSPLSQAAETPETEGSAVAQLPSVEKSETEVPRGVTTKERGNHTKREPFPVKLHRMLTEVEAEGNERIISFTISGRAFRIHQPEAFLRQVTPKYFHLKQLSSFKRQLNIYGFDRIPRGPEEGAYAHSCFQRGRPDLARKIKRLSELDAASTRRKTWKPDFSDSLL